MVKQAFLCGVLAYLPPCVRPYHVGKLSENLPTGLPTQPLILLP